MPFCRFIEGSRAFLFCAFYNIMQIMLQPLLRAAFYSINRICSMRFLCSEPVEMIYIRVVLILL